MLVLAPALLLPACQGDTGFTNTSQDVQTQAGDPALAFEPQEVVFTELTVGSTYSQFLTFESTGEGDLILYRVVPEQDLSGAFEIYGADSNVIIPPGESADLTVIAILAEDAPATAEISVQTNVSDLLEFWIPLSAYPAGWEPADTADTGL